MNEEDERIEAWHRIARHPFFADSFKQEPPLIDSMLKRLDSMIEEKQSIAVEAQELIEWRLLRAYSNGYTDGLRRGVQGGLDR